MNDPLLSRGRELCCLPPELSRHALEQCAQIAAKKFQEGGYDDNWCAEASEAISRYLQKRGIGHYVSNAGCRTDDSHVYVVLKGASPFWRLTILDATIRQYIDAPRTSSRQRDLAHDYPFHQAAPSIALVPPGHPFYAQMGYNPDWNVQTIMDPEWPGYDGEPPSPNWRPGPEARLWHSFAPAVWIDYSS